MYETVKRWYDNKEEQRIKSLHRYAYYLRCQNLSGILKISVFTPWMVQQGNMDPAFDIFLNVDGDEYITRYFVDGQEKWSKALIWNLQNVEHFENLSGKEHYSVNYWYHYNNVCDKLAWINPEGLKQLRRTLKQSGNAFEIIQKWQEQVKTKKRDEADAKVFKPWDDDLKLVPELPKRFINWAFKENTEHYIFYDTGSKTGYCSRCQKEVPLVNPRHRKDGTCPRCKHEIVYMANGKKSKYLRTPVAESQIIQPIKEGYVIQILETQRDYAFTGYTFDPNIPISKPNLRYDVKYKIIVRDNGTVTAYTQGLYKNRLYRWIPDSWYSDRYMTSGRIWHGNIKEIEARFPHSAAPILLRKELNMSFLRYVDFEKKYPVMESLMKIGLYDIVKDLIRSTGRESLKNKEAAKALELDKNRLKRLIELGGSINTWNWLQVEKKSDTVFETDMLRYFDRNKIEYYDLQHLPKISLTKIWHYLAKQEQVTGETASQLVTTWRDYLSMAGRNKLDTSLEYVYKPTDLKKAHAEQIELSNRENVKKEAATIRRKFKKAEKNLKEIAKYEYHSDKYAIIPPKDIEDIVLEGTVLKHCIHRCDFYFERINTKESFILFLRKESSLKTPWYTLEVEPGGNIRQKRTTGDNQNPDLNAALPFLKKWQEHIKKIMNEEDRKLAGIADKKRQANYRDIRANKKIVWHGKHQGELLADVLEADFMAAI